ncbi:phage antirepressor KilAC domain-containing protein [Ruminococcus bicirculans (ex Wegman et al. 2014)]|uniref:phage antirepressor KilAC domain-containing protein n=1 Tax=Ruminococcus bicirculans (ex Wegman et al. 2014) TaxID=1160721 RepID=UPI00242EA145|nr:phage antirepressor KilAC domain-containing protein [Ruminococcus bicirculans (ex Wegman et al. 2014)]
MSNVIKIFENEEFGSVRTFEEQGKVLFCGSDVAKALGYSKPNNAISAHCRCALKRGIPHPQSTEKTIIMTFIPEGDVYRLISHSRLPSAEKFESWIFDEVLPTIRKTGGYVSNENMFIENYFPFLEEPYQKLFRLQMTAIRRLNERIRHDQPLVEFANQVSNTDNLINMNSMAKLARAENIPVGRNKLYGWLKGKGVLMANNLPYQRYIDRGYFAVKESVFEVDGMKKTYQQTLVTGKGQRFVINLLKKYYGKEVLQ